MSRAWRFLLLALGAVAGLVVVFLVSIWLTTPRYANAPDFTLSDQYGRLFRLSTSLVEPSLCSSATPNAPTSARRPWPP